VVFGAGTVTGVLAELESLGLERVLLVASPSAAATADVVASALGDGLAARIDEVRQHVPETLATRAMEVAKHSGADGVLTVGGGSATGLGKAVAVATGVPLVAVPTTYSGSEATPIYGITGPHKRTGRDPRALPRVVVYDPELTTSMPRHVTATSGLNAVAHCVEALYSRDAEPVSALVAEHGLHLLASALPRAVRDPHHLAVREDALMGAYLAGWALASAGSALHHTLCHVLGGDHGLGHGDLHAVLLPYVVAFNAPATPEAMGRVARALGTEDAVSGITDLAHTLGAPSSLRAIGFPEDSLGAAAQRAGVAVGDRNPRPVDPDSLRRLLEDAFHGRPPGTYHHRDRYGAITRTGGGST
jgi:maleylacetate reductase